MRNALLAIALLSLVGPLAVASPEPRITVSTLGDGGGGTVHSASYAFSYTQGPFSLRDVTYEGAALFSEIETPYELRSVAVAGASFRAVPDLPRRSDAVLEFTDSAVGELRVGLPPSPILPPNPIRILLAETASLTGEGVAYTLTTGSHTFALRFDEAPSVDGDVVSFHGKLKLRLVPVPSRP